MSPIRLETANYKSSVYQLYDGIKITSTTKHTNTKPSLLKNHKQGNSDYVSAASIGKPYFKNEV